LPISSSACSTSLASQSLLEAMVLPSWQAVRFRFIHLLHQELTALHGASLWHRGRCCTLPKFSSAPSASLASQSLPEAMDLINDK
jgi:hypothetical protein